MSLSVRSSSIYPPAGIVPVRKIVGLLSDDNNFHPFTLIGKPPGLYSSIHSSALEASVPIQATSLMMSSIEGVVVTVGVTVIVRVTVTVLVKVVVAVRVAVAVGVDE